MEVSHAHDQDIIWKSVEVTDIQFVNVVVTLLPIETMFLRVKKIGYETESTENPLPDSKP